MFNKNGIIYMVTERHERTVKVGFTRNLKKRMKHYHTHSTCIVFIETMNGTKAEEKAYHHALAQMGYKKVFPKVRNSEWFYLPEGMKKEELLSAGFKIFG